MAANDLGRQAIDRLMGGHLDQWLRAHAHLSHAQMTSALASAPGLDGQPIGVHVSKNTLARWRARAQASGLTPV